MSHRLLGAEPPVEVVIRERVGEFEVEYAHACQLAAVIAGGMCSRGFYASEEQREQIAVMAVDLAERILARFTEHESEKEIP